MNLNVVKLADETFSFALGELPGDLDAGILSMRDGEDVGELNEFLIAEGYSPVDSLLIRNAITTIQYGANFISIPLFETVLVNDDGYDVG